MIGRRVAMVVALALFATSGCSQSENAHKGATARRLETPVDEQRAEPRPTPAVPDRRDVTPRLTERWRWPSPDGGDVGLPATDSRGVVTTHTQRHLVALDSAGRLIWSVEHLGLRPVEPLLTGDLVVVAGEDDVVAVDRATGAARWTAPIGHERANAPALAGASTVVVTTWEGRLVALDLESGVVRWTVTLEGPSLWKPVASAAIVVAAWDGGWGAFDLADGRTRWTAELRAEGMGSPALVALPDAPPVAVVVSDGRVDAVDLDGGQARWRTTIWVGTAIDQGSTVLPGKHPAVAIPDRAGGVTVLDAATGDLQWFRDGTEGDQAERGSPSLVRDGMLAYALDLGGLRIAWPGGELDFEPGGLVAGAAALGGGLVLTTWQGGEPAIVALEVLIAPPSD